YLARNPEARERVRGLVTLASQATEAGATLRGRANATRIMLINNLAGPARRRLLGFGPENEFRGVVNQWFRWNWRRRWLGNDGFDYLEAAKGITVPTLWFAGTADRYIAPVRGCRRIYEALGSRDVVWLAVRESRARSAVIRYAEGARDRHGLGVRVTPGIGVGGTVLLSSRPWSGRTSAEEGLSPSERALLLAERIEAALVLPLLS